VKTIRVGIAALALLTAAACGSRGAGGTVPGAAGDELNATAESYVRLVLAMGRHDENYVDAYYGPDAWRQQAEQDKLSLPEIRTRAESLLAAIPSAPPENDAEPVRLRRRYLRRQLEALVARAEMLEGRKLSFDEESKALYDAVAPTHPAARFQEILDRLETLLPGEGPLTQRLEAFREHFTIPPAKIDAVFQSAIRACRDRTSRHIQLPAGESFRIEYVKGKPWSAYNWYQGELRSLIQVNTDLPIPIDRALDLACHEGYPGHHLYNALLEQELVKRRGWVEYTVYALFSPQSLIAEGSANYGVELVFPGQTRVAFEREVLFPVAGLDPTRAAEYYAVQERLEDLSYAGNEAARGYLDGTMSADAAKEWLMRYALMSKERAEQRIRFIETYRSYVINYNLGEDLVRGYVERRAGSPAAPEAAWRAFRELISSPRLPSGLALESP
jgi:hypothetical protein